MEELRLHLLKPDPKPIRRGNYMLCISRDNSNKFRLTIIEFNAKYGCKTIYKFYAYMNEFKIEVSTSEEKALSLKNEWLPMFFKV